MIPLFQKKIIDKGGIIFYTQIQLKNMKARPLNLRSNDCYFYRADCQHKCKFQGDKCFIINYWDGDQFNVWSRYIGNASKEEMAKRKDWIKANGAEFQAKFKLPL